MKSNPNNNPYHQQRGLSLVEILVSVLILSIGLLGIAGLQGASLKSTRSASLRTQAITLSQGIMESMHANRTEATTGNNYTIAFGATATDSAVDCGATDCTTDELAQYDRFRWWQQVHDTKDPTTNKSKFPLGTGEISIDSAGLATVSIRWRDNVRQNISDPNEVVDEFTTFSITSML